MDIYERWLSNLLFTPFFDMSYSAYNFIDDDGYVSEARHAYKENFNKDDFEYNVLPLSMDEKNKLKSGNKFMIECFNKMKNRLENDLQKDLRVPKHKAYLVKESGSIISVRLKGFKVKK